MPRTTALAVQGIINDIDGDVVLDPFIEVANELVTELCTGSGYSNTRLELIERWLAAHFYSVDSPKTTLEHAENVRVFYEGKTDLGLDFTRYGQQAKLLDTKGNLAALDANNSGPNGGGAQSFDMTWLGSDCE